MGMTLNSLLLFYVNLFINMLSVHKCWSTSMKEGENLECLCKKTNKTKLMLEIGYPDAVVWGYILHCSLWLLWHILFEYLLLKHKYEK